MTTRLLLADIEKRYGVDFGERKGMTLAEYLRKSHLPSLAKVLDKLERKRK